MSRCRQLDLGPQAHPELRDVAVLYVVYLLVDLGETDGLLDHLVVVGHLVPVDGVEEEVFAVERSDAVVRAPDGDVVREHEPVDHVLDDLSLTQLLLLTLAHKLGEQAHLLEVVAECDEELELLGLLRLSLVARLSRRRPRLEVEALE